MRKLIPLLLLTCCTAADQRAAYRPGPLSPDNCGTPDAPKACRMSRAKTIAKLAAEAASSPYNCGTPTTPKPCAIGRSNYRGNYIPLPDTR
jgi:hypothetical protein